MMVRTIFSGAWRIGRVTALTLGAAVMLALVVGVTSAAFGSNGDPWILGQNNTATLITKLGGSLGVDGAMVQLKNNNADANDTALDLQVQTGEAPMTVNSNTRVDSLNADLLDGRDSTSFVASNIYKTEDPISAGILLGDGTRAISKACLPGDVLLSGGPANINGSGTILLESFPTPGSTNSWTARIANTDGTPDNFNVVVLCANQ
jgi:hypothetical protein